MPDEKGVRSLYVVESCDSSCVGSVLGVQKVRKRTRFFSFSKKKKTPWKQWLSAALERGFSVAWLPLDREKAAALNETAMQEFFRSVEGFPYGFPTFLFGLLDTPSSNLPPPISSEIITLVLPVLARILPREIDLVFGGALNHRLNTTGLVVCCSFFFALKRLLSGLSISQIIEIAHNRSLSLADLYTIPEQGTCVLFRSQPCQYLEDSWKYSNNTRSMVCNVFWTNLVRSGGLFGQLEFQAEEATPSDSYEKSFPSLFVLILCSKDTA